MPYGRFSMGKLDIGVGDEFPVDETQTPSPETQETVRAAREEWRRHKDDWRRERDEWRRKKDEWRAHRDQWRNDMRARKESFKADLRRAIYENFGPRAFRDGTTDGTAYRDDTTYRLRGGMAVRIAAIVVVIALSLVLLPFLLM